jgi:hypothetical protein
MNPLFRNFEQRKLEMYSSAARPPRTWASSAAGRLASLFRPNAQTLQNFANTVRGWFGATKSPGARETAQTVGDAVQRSMFDSIMSSLGPLGAVVTAMIRPAGQPLVDSIQQELDAAAQVLRGFGYEVTPPGQSPGNRTRGIPVTPDPQPPATLRPEPVEIEPTPVPSPRPVGGGNRGGSGGNQPPRGIPAGADPNDPLFTGEMIPVSSSNVHSIGYIWNAKSPQNGTLVVRFLAPANSPRQKRTGAGPLYHYLNVPPQLFTAFRAAASKGKWVWDHLRIRGTTSGHQFYYLLAAIRRGYVPRQARRIGGQEWFLRRNVQGEDGRVYSSRLNDEMIGRVGGRAIPQRGQPNRGSPSRGSPNRGGPSRGRFPGPGDHAAMN